MYCTNCGSEILPGQLFCTNCGEKVPGVYGYYTGTVQPAKKKAPVLPIVLAVCIFGVVIGGAWMLGSKVNNGQSAPDDTVVLASSEAEPVKELDIASNTASSEDKAIEESSSAASSASGYEPGGYSTMKKTENISSEFADIDAKAYKEPDLAEYFKEDYEYVTVYVKGNEMLMKPNGGLNDDTVINGKKMDELCDYIDEMLEGYGTKLNRQLFYDVLATHLVDGSMGPAEEQYFRESLAYSLYFATQFDSMQVKIDNCRIFSDASTRFYYDLSVFEIDDVWMVDYSHREILMNKGTSVYESHGGPVEFTDQSLTGWMVIMMLFYELN